MNQTERIMLRMDKKLYGQLKGYADRNDDGMVSRSARRAIRKFINEQNDQKTKTIQEVSD
jgi:metal-responsive CopG/Arc/MetJ family transcriptional regulator